MADLTNKALFDSILTFWFCAELSGVDAFRQRENKTGAVVFDIAKPLQGLWHVMNTPDFWSHKPQVRIKVDDYQLWRIEPNYAARLMYVDSSKNPQSEAVNFVVWWHPDPDAVSGWIYGGGDWFTADEVEAAGGDDEQ